MVIKVLQISVLCVFLKGAKLWKRDFNTVIHIVVHKVWESRNY
jgi:hypothetical protein